MKFNKVYLPIIIGMVIACFSIVFVIGFYIFVVGSYQLGNVTDIVNFANYLNGTLGTALFFVSLVFLGFSIAYQIKSVRLQSELGMQSSRIQLILFKLQEKKRYLEENEGLSARFDNEVFITYLNAPINKEGASSHPLATEHLRVFLFSRSRVTNEKENQSINYLKSLISSVVENNDTDTISNLITYLYDFARYLTNQIEYFHLGGDPLLYSHVYGEVSSFPQVFSSIANFKKDKTYSELFSNSRELTLFEALHAFFVSCEAYMESFCYFRDKKIQYQSKITDFYDLVASYEETTK